MEKFTIMFVSSTMKDKTNCYVKVVKTNYHDDDDVPFPKIHLIFLSKRDYIKIKEIEKIFEKYYELEKKYLKSEKEFILYHYLKEIITYLKECEAMEILSDHIEAFDFKFHYISEFITDYMFNTKGFRPQ